MKRTFFYSLFFLFAVSASNKVKAQQDPDLKYNKAKKEYRDAHPATQQTTANQRQSTSAATRATPVAPATQGKKSFESKPALNSKGLKNTSIKTQ